MARTALVGSEQVGNTTIVRGNLNTGSAGNAVIAKVIAGSSIGLTSTGADAGTGDVTISVVTADATHSGAVTTSAQTFAGAKTFSPPSTNPSNGIATFGVISSAVFGGGLALTDGGSNNVGFWLTATNVLNIGNASSPTGALAQRASLDASGNLSIGGIAVNAAGSLSFGSATRQMVNLYSTTYGAGVQNSTMYFRVDTAAGAGTNYAFYKGGVHSNTQGDPGASGVTLMTIDNTGVVASPGGTAFTAYVNSGATVSINLANGGWQYCTASANGTLALSGGSARQRALVTMKNTSGASITINLPTGIYTQTSATSVTIAAGNAVLFDIVYTGSIYFVNAMSYASSYTFP